MPLIAFLALVATISFWIKQLTKIEDFDIFGDIEDEEDL
jgi:hypothetical protein